MTLASPVDVVSAEPLQGASAGRKDVIAGFSCGNEASPILVAFDAVAFVSSDGGTGKGAQLRNLLGGVSHSVIGLAPHTPGKNGGGIGGADAGWRIIQQGRSEYLVWQQTSLSRLLAQIEPDIFLAPYNTAPLRIPNNTKLISVVHDLILMEKQPGARIKRRLMDFYRGMLLRSTIKRSSLILTVSHFTADRIRERYPQVRARVIHCTVGSSWYVRGDMTQPAEREPYILLVTNFVAHKNAPMAMEAFARYRALDPQSTIKLRMVGVPHSGGTVRALMKKYELPADSVMIDDFLSEAELQQVYRCALCVIVPSRMEGFGIPALEAMASGTPLVCSNTGSLPEVGGNAPLYFDPTNVEDMTQALFRACKDSTLRTSMIEKGLERAEIFHPDRIQTQIVEFWRELSELCKSWST